MIVIDASVGVKWFLKKQEPERDIALKIQKNHLEGREVVVVPELFLLEIANVLLFKANISLAKAREINSILFEIDLRVLQIDERLLDLALYLGDTRKITIYDALYIAMSITLSIPFITADEKLHREISDLHSTLLKDY